MRRFVKFFAAFVTDDGSGAGGAGKGGDGGAGGAGDHQLTDEEKALAADKKLAAEAAAQRTRANRAEAKLATLEPLAAKATVLEGRVAELEAKLAGEAGKSGAGATGDGKNAITAEEAATLRKELGDVKAELKTTREETAKEKQKALDQTRENRLRRAIEQAGITGEREIDFALGNAERFVTLNQDGTFTAKYKTEQGEIEGPLDADFIKAITPVGLFPAKGGGGSGGRSPANAGGGKQDQVLREYSQAEWDKMTPDERKAVQRKRAAAQGVQVR